MHGVSGAGAAQVLKRPHVQQVAGDRRAGFYRPRSGYPDSTEAGGASVEAYRWSDLPSGTAVRTLSLVFLLPFMLCNVAIWMRPASFGSGAGIRALCRVLALTLTVLYVLSLVGVAVDLVAWKCLASPHCLAGRAWLSWLGGRPPGQRLAVSALVPIAAIGLVWWLATRPGFSFEAFHNPVGATSTLRLAVVEQRDDAPVVGRLRSIHVAAAFATLDGVLLIARGAPRASLVTIALGLATAGVLLAGLALLCAHPLIDRPAPNKRIDGTTQALRAFACGLTVVVLVHVLTSQHPWPTTVGLPGYGATVAWILAGLTALLLALGTATVLRRRGGKRIGGPVRGLGAPVIATVATVTAVAFSAELLYRVSDLLNRNAPAEDRQATSPPLTYEWAIFGFFLAVVAALAVAALVALISRRSRFRAAAAIVARDFPQAPPEAVSRLRQVQKAIARARFTEQLEPLIVVYAPFAALGLAASTSGLLGLDPGDVVERFTGIPLDLVNSYIGIGSYFIGAIVLGLVFAGIFAYRTAGFRRYIGVVWDLGTFWPRSAHPFAPPCYGDRAVTELARRITYLVDSGHPVLLAGHSHGSVLLAATVLQLPPHVSRRVALLTYASPLRRLYARLFPAYVNQEALHEVGERLGWRWVNLWRDTDPIGSWIFSAHSLGERPAVPGPAGKVDRRLRDPWDVVIPAGDSVPPPIVGHWPGESDERFAAAVRELADRLRGREASERGERRSGWRDGSGPVDAAPT
ncbi:hypothetical protein ABT214_04395 [Micromonospora purpureochromogenes]|uniref:hypothetical protein n=1 Tax=Micromonospora purpureochromogenes TaxID=47872 RepID=UPI003318D76A